MTRHELVDRIEGLFRLRTRLVREHEDEADVELLSPGGLPLLTLLLYRHADGEWRLGGHTGLPAETIRALR